VETEGRDSPSYVGIMDRFRQLGVEWFDYIDILATTVDNGRARLVMYHPDLVHEHHASITAEVAHLAADNIIAAVARRNDVFPVGVSMRRGVAWDKVHGDYMSACAAVQEVRMTLGLAVETLLYDELHWTKGSITLTDEQRVILVNSRRLLGRKTNQFIDDAQLTFVYGYFPFGTVRSSIPVSNAN
jgi:hypothetical protein